MTRDAVLEQAESPSRSNHDCSASQATPQGCRCANATDGKIGFELATDSSMPQCLHWHCPGAVPV